jgi:hypothetical protein
MSGHDDETAAPSVTPGCHRFPASLDP